MIPRPSLRPLRRLRWKLTLTYTLVTVAALVVVEVLVLAGLLLLAAGCGGSADKKFDTVGASIPSGGEAAKDSGARPVDTVKAGSRDVIYTGNLVVRVADVVKAAQQAQKLADDVDGYLAKQEADLEGDQEVTATSRITRHAAGVAEPFAIVDITEAYKSYCSSVMRGIRVVDNRTALLVQDEFVLTQKGTVTWGMTTDAVIQIENPNQARLTLGGKTLTARILSPAQAVFSVASAEQSPPQKTNTGVSRLLATVPATTGNLTLTVLLSPHRTDAVPGMIPRPGALATW